MAGNIYLLNKDESITKQKEMLFEKEDIFQSLIERYPEILAGDQMQPDNPRKFLLVSREMGVPDTKDGGGRWSIDHLFGDQYAIPTFVEVKRSTDTRIRREVVAQMLEYAANGSQYWPIDVIIQNFEKSGGSLDDFELSDEDKASYWSRFEENLRSGNITLLFVADEIPMELRRIIEFLNNQMENTEVIGLEIKQFVSDDNVRTLVPHIIGQTTKALDVKKRNSSSTTQWDEESFMDAIGEYGSDKDVEIVRNLLTTLGNAGSHCYWGTATKDGGVTFFVGNGTTRRLSPFKIYPNGNIRLWFSELKMRPPFDSVERRIDLQSKFNRIEGITIPDVEENPVFNLSVLHNVASYNAFVDIIKEMIEDFKKGGK